MNEKKKLELQTIPVKNEDLSIKEPQIQAIPSYVFEPAMNVYETKDAYIFVLEMLGLDEQNVRVQLKGNQVLVESNSSRFDVPMDAVAKNIEFGPVRFRKIIDLPEDADWNGKKVVVKNGLCYLTLAKKKDIFYN